MRLSFERAMTLVDRLAHLNMEESSKVQEAEKALAELKGLLLGNDKLRRCCGNQVIGQIDSLLRRGDPRRRDILKTNLTSYIRERISVLSIEALEQKNGELDE
jgi:hypothetical protein